MINNGKYVEMVNISFANLENVTVRAYETSPFFKVFKNSAF